MELRCAEPTDWDELRTIFAALYPSNPRMVERDFFEWVYQRSPWNAGGQYTLWVAEQDNRIAGFMADIPLQVRHDGRAAQGSWPSLWWATSREIAVALFIKTMRDYDPRIYVGMTPTSIETVKALGMAVQMPLPRWVGCLDADATDALSDADAPGLERLRGSQARLGELPEGDDAIVLVDDLPEGFEAEPAAFFPDVDCYVRRNRAFLRWRYIGLPRHDYRVMLDERSGSLAVYRVEGVTDRAARVLRLVEWIVRPDRAISMMGRLVHEARGAGVALIDFFCSSRTIGGALEPLGFMDERDLGYAVPSYFRPLWNPKVGFAIAVDFAPLRKPKQVDFDKWYITKGDGDIDRIKL